jgi:hypothetical protein
VSEAVAASGAAAPALDDFADFAKVSESGKAASEHDARAAAYADFLDEIGAAVGDKRYAVASGILRGKPITGRPGYRDHDEPLFREMAFLLDTGEATSVTDAATLVAATLPPTAATMTTINRLRINYPKWKREQVGNLAPSSHLS